MSTSITFPYTTPGNYTYDSDYVEISDGKAKLKLLQDNLDFTEDFADDTDFTYDSSKSEFSGGKVQQKIADVTGLSFTEDFADDTDFTYDSSKSEFVGGQVRQVDKRPIDAVFYAALTSSKDGNWADVLGSMTGTLEGGATISGGYLDCTSGGDLKFDDADDWGFTNVGTIEFEYVPNYNGQDGRDILEFGQGNTRNKIKLLDRTDSGGVLQFVVFDQDGVSLGSDLEPFSFVLGQTYKISINIDYITGDHRVFIDGIKECEITGASGTRSGTANNLYIGGPSGDTDGKFRYVTMYDTVQHTSNYTPGDYNNEETIYLTSKVELPTMTYTGVGITEYTGSTGTEAGSPKYILDDKYWSGAAWVASDGSYAQANTLSEVNTNIGSLTPSGVTLNIDVIFDDTNTQGSVDNLEVGYTGNRYLATNVILPEMEHSDVGTIKLFNSFSTTESGSPRYTLQIGRSGDYLYWNGSAWVVSDGSYAQANTATTFNSNCASLDVDEENYGQFKIHFPESNTQSYVDELTANMNVDIGYTTDAQKITVNTTFKGSELLTFLETATKPANTECKYTIEVDGQEKHYSGGLQDSDGTYAQANTANEISTNIADFVTTRSTIRLYTFLYTSDDQVRPEIDINTITYDSVLPNPSLSTLIELEGFIYTPLGASSNTLVKIRPYQAGFVNEGVFMHYGWTDIGYTNSDGWFEASIYINPSASLLYELKIGRQSYIVDLSTETGLVDLSTLTLTHSTL